ncbi:hypothetical protein LWE61_14385 [Sphingobium sufflavum]|uniref:hypothetical protein n=1 Tax=Sphingobium sufflavum TaxID=1129547 RepID=UPI001F3E745C|nr:hypothetical protein [Sphingobium sufflavum]MCE7797735.1 hypothetical protein [Sphingobium sufflavum]
MQNPPARRFYGALFDVLGMPIGGEEESYFWVDELVVSAIDSAAAQGRPTGRHHLAFQAADRTMVEVFHRPGPVATATIAGQASAPITPVITPPS